MEIIPKKSFSFHKFANYGGKVQAKQESPPYSHSNTQG